MNAITIQPEFLDEMLGLIADATSTVTDLQTKGAGEQKVWLEKVASLETRIKTLEPLAARPVANQDAIKAAAAKVAQVSGGAAPQLETQLADPNVALALLTKMADHFHRPPSEGGGIAPLPDFGASQEDDGWTNGGRR